MSGELIGIISAAATVVVLLVVLAAALVRVVRTRRRGTSVRAALNDGLGPIASSGAAQSGAFGYTPASPAPTPTIADVDSADPGGDPR